MTITEDPITLLTPAQRIVWDKLYQGAALFEPELRTDRYGRISRRQPKSWSLCGGPIEAHLEERVRPSTVERLRSLGLITLEREGATERWVAIEWGQ